MLTLGLVTFQNALALWALLLLPVIWWLLRLTPPRPERIAFPPIRFLLGLIAKEETPHKTPWWLILLRMGLLTLLILAVARPVLDSDPRLAGGSGPLLVIVDDGWAAAKDWRARMHVLADEITVARRGNQPVVIATTTPNEAPPALEPRAAADLEDRAATLQPRALDPDRGALAVRLETALRDDGPFSIVWLSDGLDYGDGEAFAAALNSLSGSGRQVRVLAPSEAETSLAIGRPALDADGIRVVAARAQATVPRTITLRALASNARSLGEAELTFGAGAREVSGVLRLPLALRNDVDRLDIVDERTAGAVYLLDDRWRRKTVGVASGGSLETDQPLLSPLYYVNRALQPYAEIVDRPSAGSEENRIAGLIESGLSMLVLADIGQLAQDDHQAVADWVERGGVLVRFAGPRLAGSQDDLVPVELRSGDRGLGGALTWEAPQPIAPFDEQSPFAGIAVSPQVTVARQVLAQPGGGLAETVWARLADGTPLVTARKRGSGLLVLFHVTANADWSNLPLSGLFVEMLRRLLDLAPGTAPGETGGGPEASAAAEGSAFAPLRALSGFGDLSDPPADAKPIPAAAFNDTVPDPRHPAGLYGRDGHTRALNLHESTPELAPLSLPSGMTRLPYQPSEAVAFMGPLFLAALVLFLLDALAVLALSGALGQLRSRAWRTASLLAIVAAAPLLTHQQGHAQDADQFALTASLDTRLAYVVTGDNRVDDVSLAGLNGLSDILVQRTAIEPAAPMGVDIERDDIVFFPLLYWPILPDAPGLSTQAAAKVDAFLKHGGTILFDTRDHQIDVPGLNAASGAGNQSLRRILGNIDIPPLEAVPPDHVLTKAFYLLQAFPGRWSGGELWVEATGGKTPEGSANYDGVSSVIIGSNDYAAAWAVDAEGQPMFATVPGGPRQRELAYRTGINIVMYALTGNYKADQVHVPALLERLGQ